MGWQILINLLNNRGKIKETIVGNVNSCDDKENWITVSIPVTEGEEYQQFKFSQITGECLTSEPYKLADEEINLLNDKSRWQIKKYKK